MTTPAKQPKYLVDLDGADMEMSGTGSDDMWCGYNLTCEGNTLAECLENAGVSESDQDGGESDQKPLENCDAGVKAKAEAMITAALQAVGSAV